MNDIVHATEAGGVLTVTLNRPEKRNALNQLLITAIADTFTVWREHQHIVLAVLTGAGDKAFASGGDIRELAALREPAEVLAFTRATRAALDTIRNFPVPVLAALNGDALGGGAELALACDMRIMAAHARVGFLQGRLNISTAWGGGTDLLRLVGPGRALSLLCSTDVLGPGAALAAGLVDATAPEGQPFGTVVAGFVARLAARKPQVMRAFKSLTAAHRRGAGPDEMARVEEAAFTATWVHPDHWDAVTAMYPDTAKGEP